MPYAYADADVNVANRICNIHHQSTENNNDILAAIILMKAQ